MFGGRRIREFAARWRLRAEAKDSGRTTASKPSQFHVEFIEPRLLLSAELVPQPELASVQNPADGAIVGFMLPDDATTPDVGDQSSEAQSAKGIAQSAESLNANGLNGLNDWNDLNELLTRPVVQVVPAVPNVQCSFAHTVKCRLSTSGRAMLPALSSLS